MKNEKLVINPSFRERIGTVSTPYVSNAMLWNGDSNKLLKEENEQMQRFLAEGKQIICFTADCCSGIFTPEPHHLISEIARLKNPAAAYMYCIPECEGSAETHFQRRVAQYLEELPKSSAFVLGEYLSTKQGGSCGDERNFERALDGLLFDAQGGLIDPWSPKGNRRKRFYIHKPAGLTDLGVFRSLFS